MNEKNPFYNGYTESNNDFDEETNVGFTTTYDQKREREFMENMLSIRKKSETRDTFAKIAILLIIIGICQILYNVYILNYHLKQTEGADVVYGEVVDIDVISVEEGPDMYFLTVSFNYYDQDFTASPLTPYEYGFMVNKGDYVKVYITESANGKHNLFVFNQSGYITFIVIGVLLTIIGAVLIYIKRIYDKKDPIP